MSASSPVIIHYQKPDPRAQFPPVSEVFFDSGNVFSPAPKLKAIYIAGTEKKYPVLFSGQKTSCRVLMDFTSAFPADPRGAARSYTRQGSSQH